MSGLSTVVVFDRQKNYLPKLTHMTTQYAKRVMPLFLIALLTLAASSQVTLPRTPSPAASVSQTVGLSVVTVNYSRPSVKGREIWGKLVPYSLSVQIGGDNGNPAPWRAGANENTTIKFSHDAKVEGKMVPAGEYGLFFI